MKNKTTYLIQAGVTAALYAGITLATSGISFGIMQLRIAEALIVTVCFTPAAIPGLAVGCLIANVASPYGLADAVVGAVVTLLACLWCYLTRNVKTAGMPLVAPLGTVLLNGLYVGFLEKFITGNEAVFWTSALSVAVSEILVCYLLGMPLYMLLRKIKLR